MLSTKSTSDSQHSGDVSKLSAGELLRLAEECFERLEMEQASYYYQAGLNKEPNSEALLCAFGVFLKHNNDFKSAFEVLKKAAGLH